MLTVLAGCESGTANLNGRGGSGGSGGSGGGIAVDGGGGTGGTASGDGGVVILTDSQAATIMDEANTGEIQAAQVANGRSTNPAVKQFATMMVNDHTAAKQRLEQIMSSQGLARAAGAPTALLRPATRRRCPAAQPA